MPRYDYECRSCGLVFEAYNKMKDCKNARCPSCHGECGQVFITPPVVFKEILPYFDRGMGVQVQDRSDRKRKMDERGFVEADESLTRQAKEIRQEDADRKADKRR